ncbi:MAG TPA: hypothetical protein PKC19_22715, partial [Roseiflexaceae bacterium]|nr:hypothetical protein [Roseiflexaceae bacterium]
MSLIIAQSNRVLVIRILLFSLLLIWGSTLLPHWWQSLPGDAPAQAGDMLLVQIDTLQPGITTRSAAIAWQAGGRSTRLPFEYLAGGGMRRVLLPIGTHPAWHGATTDLHLDLLLRHGDPPPQASWQRLRRPAWAFDLLLAGWYARLLGDVPNWGSTLLLTAILLSIPAILVAPRVARQRQAALIAMLLTGAVALAGGVRQVEYTLLTLQQYGRLDPQPLQAAAPTYNEGRALGELLVAASRDLSLQPVLLLDGQAWSYPAYRARYLFSPRQVDALPRWRVPAADVRELLIRRYGTLIERAPPSAPPLPGWRLFGSAGGMTIWSAPGDAPPPALPADTLAPLRFLLALLLIVWAGWGLAGWCG